MIAKLLGGDDDAADSGSQGRDLAGLMAMRQQDGLTRAAAGLLRLGSVQGAQAYCLDCAIAAPAPQPEMRGNWLVRLAVVLGLR